MREMQDFDRGFAAALDGIYEAAAGGGSWEAALERVCDFIGAQGSDLCFVNPGMVEFLRIVPARLDVDSWARYLRDYTSDIRNINPRIPHFLSRHDGAIWAGSELWTPRERGMLPFFAEMVHPAFHVFDEFNTWIRKSDDGRPWICLLLHFCPHDAGPTAEARRRLQVLLPHLRRAFGAEERLRAALQENTALTEALDQVAEALALVDHAGRVLRANEAAMKIFTAEQGLKLAGNGHLVVTHSTARDAYAHAVSQCISPMLLLNDGGAMPPATVTVPRVGASPLILTLQPLPRSQWAACGAVAALFITDPTAKPLGKARSLKLAYGLSPSQIRLVQALAEGYTLKEFASQQHLSYETARSYLRQVLAKTGLRRQADLVALSYRMR